MFGFFKSSCPIDVETQEWVDERMDWLGSQFGWERLRNAAVVVPSREFFPDPYAPTEEHLRDLLTLNCGYMDVDPSRVELKLYSDDSPVVETSTTLNQYRDSSAGFYHEQGGIANVWINVNTLDDPAAVVATMAHELGHVHLLGDGRVAADADDHEPLTDLLTVFFGMGVMNANAVVRDRNYRVGNLEGWSIRRQGYLTMPVFGYALACFAYARLERKPSWAKHLRLDVSAPFRQSLRHLQRVGG